MMKATDKSVVQEETFRIRTYEIDSRKLATVPALVKLMHEAAMQNVIDLGVSVWDLEPHHLSWVLLRKSLQINRLPALGESIKIVTYPAGFDRLFTYRDYKVYDEGGSLLAHSASTWVLMDTRTRALARIPAFILDFRKRLPPAEAFLERPEARLPVLDRIDRCKEFVVNWHDLDFNLHLNNSYYVQWMLEALPVALLGQGKLRTLDIHYKAESRLEDKLLSESGKSEESAGTYLHRLVRETDGKELALGRTVWEIKSS